MARGLEQKIFFPIRKDSEDLDRANAEEYLKTLKSQKENKKVKFFVRDAVQGEVAGIEIVLLDKTKDETDAQVKGFRNKEVAIDNA